jgi:hypothetical protein
MVIYPYLGHVRKIYTSMMYEVLWNNDNDQQHD